MFTLRPARESDRNALYRICLETGDSGQAATGLYRDPELLGHAYAGPYLSHSPAFAFVLEGPADVGGYVLGTPDTRAFEATLEREWWPALRRRYADPSAIPREARSPDQRMAALIHTPRRAPDAMLARYPAHLHIDLLPWAQGGGHGRRLMERQFAAFREAGVPGVHLGVGERNTRAEGFYRHLGMEELSRSPGAITFGLKL